MHTVYLALGANIGPRLTTLRRAIALISRLVGTVECQSAFHETDPEGFQSAHKFVNAALRVSTNLTPRELLSATQQIERELGRTRKSHNLHYHDRPIDIDILLYDRLHIDQPDLQIPHPRMWQRAFVVQPLSEVMPPEQFRELEALYK